jgi:hypothetical protein
MVIPEFSTISIEAILTKFKLSNPTCPRDLGSSGVEGVLKVSIRRRYRNGEANERRAWLSRPANWLAPAHVWTRKVKLVYWGKPFPEIIESH